MTTNISRSDFCNNSTILQKYTLEITFINVLSDLTGGLRRSDYYDLISFWSSPTKGRSISQVICQIILRQYPGSYWILIHTILLYYAICENSTWLWTWYIRLVCIAEKPLRLQTIFIQRVTARTWQRNSHKNLQLFTTLVTTSEGCLYKSKKAMAFILTLLYFLQTAY